jgi:hypothetical protein
MPTPQDSNENSVSALDLFLGALGRVNLALGGGIAVIASFLIWHFAASTPVPLWLVALIGLPLLMTITSLALALRAAVSMVRQFGRERPTTNIVDAVPPSAPYSHCIILHGRSDSTAHVVDLS